MWYNVNKMDKLVEFLNKELAERSWSGSDLARAAGVSRTTVSNVLSGKDQASHKFCVNVALALRRSVYEVLALAGHVPTLPEPVHNEDELLRLYRQLDIRERRTLMAQIRGLAEAEKSFSRHESPAGNPVVGAHPACMAAIFSLLERKELVTREDIWIAIRQIHPDIVAEFADILEVIWQERREERTEEERAHCK